MTKKLRESPVYVAPRIIGRLEAGSPKVFDEKTRENLNPHDIDDKIKIYERQVNEWFLNRAKNLLKGKNNSFIILMVCLSYLEGVEQYRKGQSSRNRSKQFFIDSIKRIYPNRYSDNELSDFYSQARIGLFHNGMTESKIIVNYDFATPINFKNGDTIEVNPKIILNDIKQDFKTYLANLRNDEELRRNLIVGLASFNT